MSLPVKPEHLAADREWRRRSVQRQIDRRRVQLETRVEGQRTTIRRTPKPSRSQRVKPVSDKRAAENRQYRVRRVIFLTENPTCRRCGGRADTIQHAAGRRGRLLLDERFWIPLCWEPCHRWVEAHPVEAEAAGLRLPRVGKRAA